MACLNRNPVFLPKSLFDRYIVKSDGGQIKVDRIQTLGGAERKVKELARKYPCVGWSILSEKHGSVIKSYKAAMGSGAPKVDTDNTHQQREREARDKADETRSLKAAQQRLKDEEATRRTQQSVEYVLYIGGQEYATYDTRKEAEQAGKREGKGQSVRVKEVRGNPEKKIYLIVSNSDNSLISAMYMLPSHARYAAATPNATSHLMLYEGSWQSLENQSTSGMNVYDLKPKPKPVVDAKRNPRITMTEGGAMREINPGVSYLVQHGKVWELSLPGAGRYGQFIEFKTEKGALEYARDRGWKVEKPLSNPRGATSTTRSPGAMISFGKNPSRISVVKIGKMWHVRVQDAPSAQYPTVPRYHTAGVYSTSGEAYRIAREVSGVHRNPDDSPVESLYSTFHGEAPHGSLEYAESFEVPDSYAELGSLVEIWVLTIHSKGDKSTKLTAPDPDDSGLEDVIKLCSNGEGTQLYLVGGDQSLDLAALGFSEREERPQMLIGVLTELTYRAEKGFHKFRATDYYHKTGEESGQEPVLLYDAASQKMSIAGGNYLVKDVGIVD